MNSSESKLSDLLADPLSSITRLERRNLVAASFVVTLLSVTGSYPQEFATFGINFDSSDRLIFQAASTTLIIYFLAAFVISGIGDYMILRQRYHEYRIARHIEADNSEAEDDFHESELNRAVGGNVYWIYRRAKLQIVLRGIFEFIFPLILAALAISSTLWRAVSGT